MLPRINRTPKPLAPEKLQNLQKTARDSELAKFPMAHIGKGA